MTKTHYIFFIIFYLIKQNSTEINKIHNFRAIKNSISDFTQIHGLRALKVCGTTLHFIGKCYSEKSAGLFSCQNIHKECVIFHIAMLMFHKIHINTIGFY